MTPRSLFGGSLLSVAVLGSVLVADTSAPAVAALAVIAALILGGGVAWGQPVAVLVGAVVAMLATVVAAGLGASSATLIVAAPVLWLVIEGAWRSCDLRATADQSTAVTTTVRIARVDLSSGRAWLAQTAGVGVAALAVGLLVLPLIENVPAGGLTFRVLGVLVVVALAAAMVLFDLRRGR